MKCYKCRQIVPDDSVFCHYCGQRLEVQRPQHDFTTVSNNISKIMYCPVCGGVINEATKRCYSCGRQYFREISQKKKRKIKNIYCKNCGSLIDNQTRKCIGCGKLYLKRLRLKSFLNIFLMFIFIATIIILSLKLNDVNYYKNFYEARYNELIDEYNFYHFKAVIVPNDNTNLYHSFGCEDLDTSRFWIYNNETAKGKEISPCPKCRNVNISSEKKEQKNTNKSETNVSRSQQSIPPSTHNNQPKQTSKRTCSSMLCENEVSGLSFYCLEHKCYWPDCNSGRSQGGYYCLTHTCNNPGCINPVVENFKSYCERHTCYYPGCTSGQSINSVYCLMHK